MQGIHLNNVRVATARRCVSTPGMRGIALGQTVSGPQSTPKRNQKEARNRGRYDLSQASLPPPAESPPKGKRHRLGMPRQGDREEGSAQPLRLYR